MIRILLLLILVAVVIFWLIRPAPGCHGMRNKTQSWLKAGGFLGVLIFISRFLNVPLAVLLRMLPFMISVFRKAAGARETSQQVQPHHHGMTKEEARLILGVGKSIGQDKITKAHRKLIAQNHPDKGGSNYLAAKINEARDVLLDK